MVQVVERVIDPGETWAHAALDDHDGPGAIHVKNWHAKNWAGLIFTGGRVSNVVCANYQRDVSLRKVGIDFIEIEQLIVGNVGFRQQHVHVPRHAAGHGVNPELHIHPTASQRIV